MTDRFDVAIAGAGPAGAQCARDLARRDYDVVLLEAEAEDEFPRQSNKSTAGTFASMMAAFGVPDDVVMQFTDSVVLESPTEHFSRSQPGAVLEFADFKNFLVDDARDHGAEVRFDSRVSKPVREGSEPVGIEYNGDETVRADLLVDATGPAAVLAKSLDVARLERENQAIGIEWEMEGIDVDHEEYADLHDSMMLRLDHDLAPGGYAWLFHTGEDTAKVGLCYIQNESYREHADEGMSIDDYLQYWLDTDPRFEEAERLAGKQHRGSAHIQLPGAMTTDSFIAVGDTVPTIDPLWGEGIHKCMKSGRAAAITADHCLTPDERDTSAETVSLYEDLWHERVSPDARTRLAMTHLLYLADDDRYDTLLRDLQQLPEDTLAKANEGNPLAVARLLHTEDLPLLKRFAREQLLDLL